MTRADFLDLVKSGDLSSWPAGPVLAAALDLHIPHDESIGGRLWFDGMEPEPWGGRRWRRLGVAGSRFFYLVSITRANDGPTSVLVQSTPMGRLRALRTTTDGDGVGRLTLDFAGPVFEQHELTDEENQLQYREDEGWPSKEAADFLAALRDVRR